MPRKARNYIDAPYFHVMVQGIDKKFIFNSNFYKSMYLKIMQKYTKENDITIIAYCIMGNHVHVLLKPKNIKSMSRCMKQINTTFAIHYNKEWNRNGYVFRDRYKAEPIYEYYYLYNCIRYIHMNPVKANICTNEKDYIYSSYRGYLDKSWFNNNELYKELFPNDVSYELLMSVSDTDEIFVDEDISVEQSKIWLEKYLIKNQLSYDILINNSIILNKLVKCIKKECRIKNREISKLLNINEHKVGRILKESAKKLRPLLNEN